MICLYFYFSKTLTNSKQQGPLSFSKLIIHFWSNGMSLEVFQIRIKWAKCNLVMFSNFKSTPTAIYLCVFFHCIFAVEINTWFFIFGIGLGGEGPKYDYKNLFRLFNVSNSVGLIIVFIFPERCTSYWCLQIKLYSTWVWKTYLGLKTLYLKKTFLTFEISIRWIFIFRQYFRF